MFVSRSHFPLSLTEGIHPVLTIMNQHYLHTSITTIAEVFVNTGCLLM
ncbi:Uncharacterised protein [Yersinia pseudotuberculosis]|uniref:Uncharacterized protein n=1 Tax=Yersinia pseudotuberculosis TaxID=633 RepID=A0A380Q6K1_YERPU|nr:Uncharacterised protein [Yersinia pseudotuberculosis]